MIRPSRLDIIKSDLLDAAQIRSIEAQHLNQAKARKPHHYGLIDGVNFFHAHSPDHEALFGIHLKNPDESKLTSAMQESKKTGTPIILHGEVPSFLKDQLGDTLKPKLSEQGSLKKAFTQADGETMTDPREHQPQSVDSSLLAWGAKKISSMKIDDIGQFEINGRTVKIRKVLHDLYSGWIEYEGQNIHQFEKLTMPALMTQLQSKLELYGKEKEVMADKSKKIEIPAKDLIEEHKKLIGILESPSHKDDLEEAKEQRKELADYEQEAMSPETPDTSEEIVDKIKDLKTKLKETKETVSAKELIAGIEEPQSECPACERMAEKCICYLNLPRPRVEFDGKKLSIFFKNEWHEEDRVNFMNDLKARAGRILLEQRKEQAANVLAEIRKKLK